VDALDDVSTLDRYQLSRWARFAGLFIAEEMYITGLNVYMHYSPIFFLRRVLQESVDEGVIFYLRSQISILHFIYLIYETLTSLW